jgi:hypothetical protein
MHLVPNEAEIPTEAITQAFESGAVPGFNGSVTVAIQVRPQAGLEVEFAVRRKTFFQKTPTNESIVAPVTSNSRIANVRMRIAEFARKFRLSTPYRELTMHYVDGMATKFETEEVTRG